MHPIIPAITRIKLLSAMLFKYPRKSQFRNEYPLQFVEIACLELLAFVN